MFTTLAAQRRIDSTGSTTPTQLPAQTVAWLADQPHARRFVGSVWDRLAELERAGPHTEIIAALRSILTCHQPTSAGRCPTCRRLTWRHLWRSRPFPCVVWHQVRSELLPAGVAIAGS